MKTLTVYLPNAAYANAASEAMQQNVDVATLCSGFLADHFLSQTADQGEPQSNPRSIPAPRDNQPLRGLDISHQFRRFPHRSIEFAREFLDEVLKIPQVHAYKKASGIAFDPNFVYIEALLSQGTRAGIRVSFFGRPEQFKNAPAVLRMGRPPSYSRAVIETDSSDDQTVLCTALRSCAINEWRLTGA